MDGLFKLKSVGLEAGGVLFGRVNRGTVIVSRAVRFDPVYAFGPSWRLADADMERFRELLASTEGDETVVGYFVSHTRTEPILSEHNIALFESLFPETSQIALAVKPHVFLPLRCVVHYRTVAGGLASSAEFAFDEAGPEEKPVAEDIPGPPLALLLPDQPAAEVRELAVVPAVAPERPRLGARRVWMAAGAAAAGLIVLAGALYWTRGSRPAASDVPVVSQARVEAVRPAETPPGTRAEPAASPAQADEKRVRELQTELERLKNELAQNKPASDTPKQAADANRGVERRFVPPPATRSSASSPAQAYRVELEQPPVIGGAPPAPKLPVPNVVVASAPAPPPVVATPAGPGRMLWTGNLRKGALLFIENSRASNGNVTGSLPGHQARIVVEAADLTDGGMVVHTADRARAGRSEPPSAANGWNATAFEYDPKQADGVTVIEAPSAQNQWRKLVLRTNRPVSVVMISWH